MRADMMAGLGLGAVLALGAASAALAQGFPEVVPPPEDFATSREHYDYLYNLHDGGTEHTYESVPHWEGLWEAGPNNVALRGGVSPFFVGRIPPGLASGGEVALGVLTPEYEAAFLMRRENMEATGQQPYDRLTTCEPAGMPRWLLEPYVREFFNTPTMSIWPNDLANDTRRIYIGQDHVNIDNTHFPNGDSIGFWAGDHLIVHTEDVWPNDYFRGYPPTSNQFEAVEVYHMETMANGNSRIVMQGTFYDPLSLIEPLNVVYTFTQADNLEDAGFRMRHWDCQNNMNTRLTEDGQTTMAIPGEAEFMDVRGGDAARRSPDLPPDLPGQELDPNAADLTGGLDAALGGN